MLGQIGAVTGQVAEYLVLLGTWEFGVFFTVVLAQFSLQLSVTAHLPEPPLDLPHRTGDLSVTCLLPRDLLSRKWHLGAPATQWEPVIARTPGTPSSRYFG